MRRIAWAAAAKKCARLANWAPSSSSQPEPGLVNEGRGLQRLAGGFAGHLVRRQLAQFLIHQRQQFLGGLRVALPNRFEHARDLAHAALISEGLSNEKAESSCAANLALPVASPWLLSLAFEARSEKAWRLSPEESQFALTEPGRRRGSRPASRRRGRRRCRCSAAGWARDRSPAASRDQSIGGPRDGVEAVGDARPCHDVCVRPATALMRHTEAELVGTVPA